MNTSPLRRAAARAATMATAAAAVALAVAVVPAPSASAGRDTTTVMRLTDVPPNHPWRTDTRLALAIAKALPGHTVQRAHELAEQYLVKSSPAELRQYVHVGDVLGDRFTITYVGDQACAVWRSGRGSHWATPGPCTPADRMRLHNPLRVTAQVVGSLFDRSLQGAKSHRARVRVLHSLFERATFANVTWQYAPRGVGVAGVIDKNHDGLDDDARLTLHANGRALCLRFGVYPGQRSTFAWGQCRNLAPRTIDYPERPGH